MREERHIAPGIDQVSFDSAEEMLEWVAQTRANVQRRPLSEEQAQIRYGDHAVRFLPDLTIFVYFPELSEWSEDRATLEAMARKERDENLLYVWGFSPVAPSGDVGYTHRSVLWPITARTFGAARQANWVVEDMEQVAQFEVAGCARAIQAWYRKGGVTQ